LGVVVAAAVLVGAAAEHAELFYPGGLGAAVAEGVFVAEGGEVWGWP
jgi:hypothetical protein